MMRESTPPLPLRLAGLKIVLWILASAVGAMIALPSIFLIVWALCGTSTVGVLGDHATLHWFRAVLASEEWRRSLIYSTGLAFVVSLLGSLVLTMHFYFLRYSSRLLERVGYALTLIPAILPAIIYALTLRLIGGRLHLPEQILLFVGHLVFVLPMQYFVFESAQDTVPSEMLHAGSTLGANHWRNLRWVYLPSVLRALRASLVVGFFFSFDEVIVAAFVIDSALMTVPKRLWDTINREMDPSPAVVAVLLLMTYAFLLGASQIVGWVRRRED